MKRYYPVLLFSAFCAGLATWVWFNEYKWEHDCTTRGGYAIHGRCEPKPPTGSVTVIER